MGLRDSVRNFFYAATHANALVAQQKTLSNQVSALEAKNQELQAHHVEDAKRFQQCMQNAVKLLAPEELDKDTAEKLYMAVREMDTRNIFQKQAYEAVFRFGFLRSCGAEAGVEFDRIKYINSLVNLGVLPKEQEISLLNNKAREKVRAALGANELPPEMPVGQIEYLAPNGEVQETLEFYDASAFLEQLQHDSHYGVPTSVKVFSDPATGKYIDVSWFQDMDPPPKSFVITPYVPVTKNKEQGGEVHAMYTSLEACDIPSIMYALSQNAWEGKEPQSMYIHAGADVIHVHGYIYEPNYECFSATASISLNDKILYGIDSRNVRAYHNETYQTGIYSTVEEALNHIKSNVNSKEFILSDSAVLPAGPLNISDLPADKEQKPSLENLLIKAEAQHNAKTAAEHASSFHSIGR